MIGLFDSGSGGLTVLRALRNRAPNVDVVYFGDLAHAPYGNRERKELNELTVAGVQKLIQEGATDIVSACNSVSLSVAESWFRTLDTPYAKVIEMVGPTVEFFEPMEGSTALVVATRATIESGVYVTGLATRGIKATGLAVPDLVAHIEGEATHETIVAMLEKDLVPHLSNEYTHLVLGCTHFPIVQSAFAEVVQVHAPGICILDPAEAVARAVVERCSISGKGTTRFILSKESEVFLRYVHRFFPDMPYTLEVQEEELYD